MSDQDRRRKLTVDEVNAYWWRLREGVERPELHKLCNAIRTLDLALKDESTLVSRLSNESWSRIRNDCFDILVSSFRGYFLVYADGRDVPMEPGGWWPAGGTLEYYPEQAKRRDDAYTSPIDTVNPQILLRLRWCFADGRQHTTPEDFSSYWDGLRDVPTDDHAREAQEFLSQLYQACLDEALKLKKIAHRKWWQLNTEVTSCKDRRHRNELKKQMETLELLWGRGS